jgi:hypothetical protein
VHKVSLLALACTTKTIFMEEEAGEEKQGEKEMLLG